MTDLNKVIQIGRCTRDAELKYTNSGLAILRFSIAVNRKKKSGDEWKDEANFFDVCQMGKGAEAVAKYLTKGKQICVDGELHQNKWEQDGQQRSKVEIVANNIQLLGGGKQSEAAESQPSDDFEDGVPF
jgi:single-strand DNA-binding protein